MRRLLPTALLLVLVTGACGGDPQPAADQPPVSRHRLAATTEPTPDAPPPTTADRPSRRPRPSPSATGAPGAAPAPLPARPLAPGRSPGAIPADLGTHLLTSAAVPGPGAALGWTVTAEGAEGAAVAGGCHKTPLVTIGALRAARREHSSGRDARATQVVARFADRRSAWRAHRVLVAWHADCAERASRRVGPVRELTVPTGVAEGYTTAADRRGGTVSALGILRTGRLLSVMEISARSRSWRVGSPAGSGVGAALAGAETAVAVAVRRVARTFGS
ncbi:hypothetical protein [Nocardioides ferulae]|uniref:hypothetical protein n=1 Tax=Nocardioides ferulae TaxID=2340821 RepID=UPI000F86CE35|nr:hypothetical protein [Nocardioides ferulae]